MEFLKTSVIPHFNYWVYVILMMIGLHAMITKNNLIKKLVGMTIFQTAIILFYVSIGVKSGSTIPILEHHHDDHAEVAAADAHHGEPAESDHDSDAVNPDHFANPLPHVLMLTAIVVGVSTLGVALAVSQSIFKDFGSLEEDEILEKIKQGGAAIDD
ncbi:MAG: cation:proton antiporter subunit C [Verrucomicrobiae bacterium]|nr:cation:proton antiporter subunit C [Verrucomicrobiae bacterium]